ncbi:hypothetical protein CHRY9293_03254 [Chryseobacterium potabilaquae]|uniref:Uncharacterized protein n=2 Tax=Chryseobacterium potabilaquae TaxID=2675057 RepID=A0A6N4X861_9FLAO|nr:hypothetical protein CHRY9293_03254 [Chryseobacterium potabilaquae]
MQAFQSTIIKHKNKEIFSIGDVHFDNKNISINVSGIFSQKRVKISWESVRTKNYFTYFAVYSQQNPKEINRSYYYLEDWNTNILYSVLRTILRDKGIESYK